MCTRTRGAYRFGSVRSINQAVARQSPGAISFPSLSRLSRPAFSIIASRRRRRSLMAFSTAIKKSRYGPFS